MHGLRSVLCRMAVLAALCCSSIAATCRCYAQQDIHTGFDQFPEFRNISGLSGSGYGVDGKGYLSLSGPVALSSPVGPVLGRDQFFADIAYLSFDSAPTFSDTATHGSNRKAFATFGHTAGAWNLALSDLVIAWPSGKPLPIQVWNVQAQPGPTLHGHLIGSIGIQDLLGHGGSAGNGSPGDTRSSRSLFGVASYRLDVGPSPLWLTAGIGTRRFKNGFGSVSYQALKPLRVWLEHDGFTLNEGVLLAWNLTRGSRPVELTTTLGYEQARYFLWSVGLAF